MTTRRNPKADVDIVIVGGGLVGSALACALGNSDYSVLVLESGNAREAITDEYDLRVSAITGASKNFFESIGAWSAMQDMRMGQVREMQIWDEGGSGSLHLDAAETGEPCLAHIIENSVIRAALYQRLQSFANIRYRDNATIEFVRMDDDVVRLRVNGEELDTRLLVGADGARSAVRQWAEIPTAGWSFEQTAIVATIQTEKSHGFVARQRFLGTGPLAFLPLDDEHHCSIVWSADTVRAQELLALADDEFIDELGEAFEHRLGTMKLASKRAAFPLSLMQSEQAISHRVVLVGDAAHRMHPLAGQGLNLGLADVAALAELLREADADPGARKLLRRYERWRAGDTLLMLRLMDVFKRLYGSPQPLVKGVRNFGMDLLNGSGPMRRLITAFASGASGDIPSTLKTGRV